MRKAKQGTKRDGTVREARGYYYCLRRLNGKPCENRRGVPIADLEESVREALRFALHRNQEATADLLASKIAQARVEHEQRIAGWRVEHADQGEQIEKLEAEIGRLVGALAAGLSSADVVATINAKRAQVEDLKRQEAPVMPKWLTFDRAAFLEQLGEVPITPGQPRMGRQALRRLGVKSITVVPTADGWTIEGGLDFEPILRRVISGGSDAPEVGETRDTAGPDMAPHTPTVRHAPAKPGRSSMTRSGWRPRYGPPHPPDARTAPAEPWRSSTMRFVSRALSSPLAPFLR